MRVDERKIRQYLRSEATRVVPPPDMWERIQREMDRDRLRQERRALRRRLFSVPRVAVAAFAVVMLGFLVAPYGLAARQMTLLPGRWFGIHRTWIAALTPTAWSEAGRPAVTDLRWSSQEITLLR
ncbi:hypothetical protein [Symbiobacterium thermophilum]|uniref:Uncharacterized protein n=1 Tax=Symbiobacterium thermophilum (strain DSM 24528 / JCM 14929 / IAM 14863 / T) TaxID=292459 RepID=Q67T38_SYMTH|nr:hypothetical protein [Symbiobacterium thermophilum]BAD39155.1 hypothetical protein STH170 [Symbiobacterium thermophilum IAM 14863]